MFRPDKRDMSRDASPGIRHVLLLAVWLMAGMGFSLEAVAQVTFRSSSSAAVQSGTAISFVGNGAQANGNGGDVTPTLPTFQAGDLLLCAVTSHDSVNHTTATAGWARLYYQNNGAESASLFWKIAGATEANPQIIHAGGNSIIARCSAFRGVDAGNPFDVVFAASAMANSASDSTVESGSLTIVRSDAWPLFLTHIGDNPSGLTISTTGGLSWTQAHYSATNQGSDSAIGLFYAGPLVAGTAVGPLVATMNNQPSQSTGVVIALRPGSGNTLAVTRPSGTVAGDVMIASVAASPGTVNVTPPSGWSLVRQVIQGSANTSSLQTYYKVAGTGEPASYTWTLSNGAHTGAVAGIASFSGADTSFPVDVEAGGETASSLTHTAPTLTSTQPNSMLVTIHEYASASDWSTPAGMTEAVDIASRATPNAAGISMAMNYESRPVAGATGTRSASASANADSGATQSLVLKPLGGLTCFSDDFNRADGSPGGNWLVGNEGGSFGNPRIVNKRLRLTDASGSASTYVTLQRLFPAYGNKISVEFQHYAYNGSGADGIGIVLSDAAQVPIAGAFGGSLGYAPKRADQGGDTTHEGFGGGWLGVALDEFGNFSANTEGRTGGTAPGVTADAVVIRGSGSGYNGYTYLRGTGTLSPGIDNAASSSPAPGHKYRIIVDHSNGVNAMTSVERDTGSGYAFLIPPFDAKAQSGQAAVPVNWFLSFTGSTGGQSNIHEFTNLQVCSNTQQTLSLHHIRLEHGGSACGAATVTVKACADANCSALYPGAVTVDLANLGGSTWSTDPVTFSGGQTQVTLSRSTTGTVTLGAVATSPVASNATRCFTGATETCTLSFLNACFDAVEPGANQATPIFTKLAGTAFSLDVLALSGDTINTGYKGSVSVALVNPNAASGNCNDTNPGLAGVTISPVPPAAFTGSNAGRKTFSFTYPYAAANVKVRIIDTSVNKPVCSSDNFAIRPAKFTVSTSLPPDFPAGDDFTAKADSGVTAGYTGTPVIIGAVDHNAGSVALGTTLTGQFTAATGAEAQGTFQYHDVGRITFPVVDPNFTAVDQVTGIVNGVNHGTGGDCIVNNASNTSSGGRYGCVIAADSTPTLGRFRPHHYEVNATLTAACNGFTYMSQPALGVTLDLRAVGKNGNVLSRYTTGGAFSGLCSPQSCLAGLAVAGDNSGTAVPLAGRLTLPPLAWTNGTYSATGPAYSFNRPATDRDGPFDAFALRTTITDVDGVKITTLNSTDIPLGATSVLSTATRIRFGRLKLFNAHGSEQINLPIPMRTEFWNGSNFVTNTLDNCTAIGANNIQLNYVAGLNTTNMPASHVATGGSFAAGVGTIMLTRPVPPLAGRGVVDVCVDLAGDPPPACSAVSANRPWLQGNWLTPAYDDDPSSRATFGIYKGGPVIYVREIH